MHAAKARLPETSLEEAARTLPVTGAYDLVVAGGGIAGAAAAVAAARVGVSVCLLERTFGLGGLATLGHVIVWLPICDGRGRQVAAGLAEEMLRLSVADLGRERRTARFIGIPGCWQPGGDRAARAAERYQAHFNPSSYLLALEQWVLEAGVHLLYDTRVCAVRREADRITHLIVENKSGRSALACETVVDATGDADVCWLAGEPTESLDSNVLAGWYYYFRDEQLHLDAMTNRYDPYAGREVAAPPFFRGDEAGSVTAHVVQTREKLRERMAQRRAKEPEVDFQLFGVPMIPCLRMTRRLEAPFALGEGHVHQPFEDAIGLTGDWRKAGPVYAIPYRALTAPVNRNLLVAGRCISADRTAWDVTRAIPGCAVTGEAAGTAAALAVRQNGGDVSGLPIAALRTRLAGQGVLLDPELVRA